MSLLQEFINSEVGSWVVIAGIILAVTFGGALSILTISLFLHLDQWSTEITIGVLCWLIGSLYFMIWKGDDYIFKKIYPDWGNEEIIEAFGSPLND